MTRQLNEMERAMETVTTKAPAAPAMESDDVLKHNILDSTHEAYKTHESVRLEPTTAGKVVESMPEGGWIFLTMGITFLLCMLGLRFYRRGFNLRIKRGSTDIEMSSQTSKFQRKKASTIISKRKER